MTFHISLVGRSDLSGEIYRQIRQAILDGRLRPGERLSPTRELAAALTVSRSTVTVAYESLLAEGFATSHTGAGTFVSHQFEAKRPASKTRRSTARAIRVRRVWETIPLPRAFDRAARFDFRTGLPDASLFPHRAWRRVVARALRSREMAAGVYENPAGNRDLRAAIARHIGISRSVSASPDDVIVTNGTQQAVDIVARVLLEPGDVVAMEDPGYRPLKELLKALGARVIGVPVDSEGLVVQALPAGARAVYVTPSHQFPLGVAMSLSRRRALLAWAERNNAVVVEDDYDSEFRFGGRPLEPLQTIDSAGRVAYVGTFSKTLLPALRLAFMVVPPSLREAAHKAKFVTDWHTATIAQSALAQFIDEGAFARHIRRVSRIYSERHAMLTAEIKRNFGDYLDLIPSSTGLHITACARGASADHIDAIVSRAFELGVAIDTMSPCRVDGKPPAGFVLGYGAIETARIAEGLKRLRRCFDERVPRREAA
ncbi:PLP-dependent aminotransferase family protein [Bradyrhizobium valentinum]|uniref:GntR family transcriptional regulator n=1 Tax=Bradyrhizobium valentinum TaxID=1518501 RepID=A0A0R3M443_9BRAD|nr:PLP-dependent aminotransferase family protein [Bradyrhizobium valentinum]KRR07449.1 GntR family transcriptional regulator [Bradyrhizobium valentinum]KRR12783.1 GntR family transcriptional regulator [Bradyrhizobium valentinum]